MSDYESPTFSIPLANSYNQRGINGSTSLTAGKDQRKINCLYEIIRNSVTGKTTLYLVKRPGFGLGIAIDSGVLVPLLIASDTVDPINAFPWVFSASGSAVKVTQHNVTSTVVAVGAASCFIDSTKISGTNYNVLQVRLGPAQQRVFFANLANSWTEITDADFTAINLVGKMEYLDGFAFVMGSDNYIYNSDLNSLSSWSANNRILKSIQQDTGVGLALLGQQILAFGLKSVEVFRNAGNPSGSPLQSIPELAASIGLFQSGAYNTTYVRHYYAVLNKVLYFMGSQSPVSNYPSGVFTFNGSSFQKISTPAIDKILAGSQLFHVQRFSFLAKEAISISLTSPITTPQRWLMYFPDVNEWFEWTSQYVQPVSDGASFIGIDGTTNALISSFSTSSNWADGGSVSYGMSVQFQLPKLSNARKFMSWASVEADNVSALLNVERSDDDYSSFASVGIIDLSSPTKRIDRLGSYRNAAIRLSNSDNKEIRLEKFLARIK